MQGLVIARSAKNYDYFIDTVCRAANLRKQEARELFPYFARFDKIRGYKPYPTVYVYGDWYESDAARNLVMRLEDELEISPIDAPPMEAAN